MSRARNAGEIAFWIGCAQPSCGDRARRGRGTQVRLRFGLVARNPLRRSPVSRARNAGELVALHFWRKSRTKRSFWRLGASLLEEVSYETLVLETWRFTFGGNLVRNAGFGDLAFHFWRKSGVWYETLILKTWRFTCGAGLRAGQFVVQM